MFNFLFQNTDDRRMKALMSRRAEELRALHQQQMIADAAMREAGVHMVIIHANGTITPNARYKWEECSL